MTVREAESRATVAGRPRWPRSGAPVVAVVLALALASGVPGRAHGQAMALQHDQLGTVDFPVSCSARAQVEFNHAVALLHHMTYPLARESFQRAARIDSRCGMAHWGIAMSLFHPLWPTRPTADELQLGWAEARRAATAGPLTRRELLLVRAVAEFFREPASGDYWRRVRNWERAMERAYTAFPRDPEVTVFYGLAHLAAAPSDTSQRAHAERAASLLLAVYARNPDHPGAMHYLVHANDAQGREHESLDIVRKYETIAPDNPHALHMPTHIYTRLGDWSAVIDGNLRAADAALKYPAGERGQFVWDEFPHTIEYLLYAYLQQGADDKAAAQLQRLLETPRLQPTFKTAFHLASTRARYALERRAWREAMALVPREPPALAWDRFPWPEAITWFASGLGAAHEGKLDASRTAVQRMQALEDAASEAGEDLFARNIRILRLELSAWIAHVGGDSASSVPLMREAAELETTTPKHAVTPAPTLPAYELLGDLLLERANPADALAAYRRALELYPRRFNSLWGGARAARAAGDLATARTFYETLLELAPATHRAAADEARAFLSRHD